MKIFIDTANTNEIREVCEMGFISGVTTNPSLIAKEGKNFIEVVKEINTIIEGPVSAEVVSETAEEMVKEAIELIEKINSPNTVIKIPMSKEGLCAVSRLSKEGIRTNVTLVFSSMQALLAARAGATYVSPFVGRLDDVGAIGVELIGQIAEIFEIHNIQTEIIAASIRTPIHALEVARAGANIATIPYKVIMKMINHPLTDSGIKKFLSDWEKALGEE